MKTPKPPTGTRVLDLRPWRCIEDMALRHACRDRDISLGHSEHGQLGIKSAPYFRKSMRRSALLWRDANRAIRSDL